MYKFTYNTDNDHNTYYKGRRIMSQSNLTDCYHSAHRYITPIQHSDWVPAKQDLLALAKLQYS